jgi:glutamate-1-semialdehyde 2,1-aminomutase
MEGRGSRLWDADRNEYIDFNMGFGALVTGHAHPVLTAAICDQIRKGTVYGYECADCDELAKIITERFHVDMVRFSSTGAEGTMHAIRIARAHTSRRKVMKFEGCYHGSHDALLVSVHPAKEKQGHPRRPNRVASSKGIPDGAIEDTVVAPFNDIEATRAIAETCQDDLAAIILEPIALVMGFVPGRLEFIRGLREIADDTGTVLIFDEVKTSGKFYHGVSDYYHIEPDMKVMAKAIAGGYPLSAIGGKREIMEKIIPGEVAHAGTFNSNPLCVRAGIVTLKEILTQDAFKRLERLGGMLATGYESIVKDRNLRAQVQWGGLSGTIMFTDTPVTDYRTCQMIDIGKWFTYYVAMLNRGIIPFGTAPDEQWTISVQHSEEDIQKNLRAFDEAAELVPATTEDLPIVEAL